jgi:hypothetical protein
MCSLRFENNLLIADGLPFEKEENTIIEAFVRFRFYIVVINMTTVGDPDGYKF